jgi:hypothetical protein
VRLLGKIDVRTLPFLGALSPAGPPGRLLDGPAHMHDPGRFELDVLGLKRNEFAPAQPGPLAQTHGDRPAPVPESLQGVEQGRGRLKSEMTRHCCGMASIGCGRTWAKLCLICVMASWPDHQDALLGAVAATETVRGPVLAPQIF